MASLLLVLILAGCQSTGTSGTARTAKPERQTTSITFESDADMLSALLRQAGPMIHKGGVVIMNGSGRIVVAAQEFRGVGTTTFAEKLASEGSLQLATTPHYAFLYPEGYEVLAETDFTYSGALSEIEASASFGDGTRLYNALAILSKSLGVSIVADNIVADILCGEVVIRETPLAAVIEALLRSARATADAVKVEANDDFVFLHAAANSSRSDNLLNADSLTKQQQALLANRVNIVLPAGARRSGVAVFLNEAMELGDVLDALGRQLGVPVRAEEAMLSLPVNYTVLNGVTMHDALNLIVRQWPLDKFGFSLDNDGVLLRAR